jgi:hypothetical protein
LQATAPLWAEVRPAYALVHQAAHVLANHDAQPGAAVRAAFDQFLGIMAQQRNALGALGPAIDQFLKVTASYQPGLFHCDAVPDLPRTNNDLEHLFGATRYQERRATGRKLASPTLVVRGSVRIIAAVVSRGHAFTAADLRPRDLKQWRALRATIEDRHATRRSQRRFRRDPAAYFSALEGLLLKAVLPP